MTQIPNATKKKRRFRIPLHWQIIGAMILGVVYGLVAIEMQWQQPTRDFVKPFGTIFVNLLKLIAVPLVLASLIKGIASLRDLNKLSRIGGRTFGIYLVTTVIAISVGLLVANLIAPGESFPEDVKTELSTKFGKTADETMETAEKAQEKGPLQFLVDIVPENIVTAASDNRNMLQVIFFALVIGLSIILIPEKNGKPVLDFFDSLNDIIIKAVDLIMLAAPYGVFALIGSILVDTAGDDPASAVTILLSLLQYSGTVILGLLIMLFIVYPVMMWILVKNFNPFKFYKAIFPAQMLAFTSSSSAAALPVTMERAEQHLGISKEVTSFVLPLGATINMDGTSLYQAVATLFIAQSFGIDLTFVDQLNIILTATLASIGAAAVPGAGLVMLIMVLNSVGIGGEGIALILAVDRILDMCRTTVNVTSDCAVATIISAAEHKLKPVSDSQSWANEQVNFPRGENEK